MAVGLSRVDLLPLSARHRFRIKALLLAATDFWRDHRIKIERGPHGRVSTQISEAHSEFLETMAPGNVAFEARLLFPFGHQWSWGYRSSPQLQISGRVGPPPQPASKEKSTSALSQAETASMLSSLIFLSLVSGTFYAPALYVFLLCCALSSVPEVAAVPKKKQSLAELEFKTMWETPIPKKADHFRLPAAIQALCPYDEFMSKSFREGMRLRVLVIGDNHDEFVNHHLGRMRITRAYMNAMTKGGFRVIGLKEGYFHENPLEKAALANGEQVLQSENLDRQSSELINALTRRSEALEAKINGASLLTEALRSEISEVLQDTIVTRNQDFKARIGEKLKDPKNFIIVWVGKGHLGGVDRSLIEYLASLSAMVVIPKNGYMPPMDRDAAVTFEYDSLRLNGIKSDLMDYLASRRESIRRMTALAPHHPLLRPAQVFTLMLEGQGPAAIVEAARLFEETRTLSDGINKWSFLS